MSLDLINHKLTTSTTDDNGVIWWSNPVTNVKINSEGRVYNRLDNKLKTSSKVGYYSIRIKGVSHPTSCSFASLYSRIVVGEKLGTRTIVLKDKQKGWVEENTEIKYPSQLFIDSVKQGSKKATKLLKSSDLEHKKTKSCVSGEGVITWSNPDFSLSITSQGRVFDLSGKEVFPQEDKTYIYNYKTVTSARKGWNKWNRASFSGIFLPMVLGIKGFGRKVLLLDESKGYVKGNYKVIHITSNTTIEESQPQKPQISLDLNEGTKQLKQYYTLYEAKNEHTTEDGAVFPTKELAEWHQEKVSKGKGNAQVVLDYNGGYVLAEQIYLQEVVYNKAKPYTNFIDVLNNNQGIVSVVQEEHCKFDKLDNEHGFRSEICFMTLRKQLPEQVSKHQAQKIQGAIERYSDSVKALDESIVGLEALLKQVK